MYRTALAAAILSLSMTVAHAEEVVSTQVSYGDLNLAYSADAKVLAERLQDAGKSVCLKANPDFRAKSEMEYCIDAAVKSAMARIESNLGQAITVKLDNVRTAMKSP